MSQTVLDCAMHYSHLGLAVIPLHYPIKYQEQLVCSCGNVECKRPAKHPIARLVPNGLKNATTDITVIEDWFRNQPWNIGIVTGKTSGFFGLDIDPHHHGDNSLADLEAQNGALPKTWRFLTGGGGHHDLFRHPGGVIPNSVGKIAPGIDVRGDHGYLVAPPSKHISGGSYSIAPNSHPNLADAPEWLLARICSGPCEDAGETIYTSGPGERSEAQEKRIRSALQCIPADNRDVWLRIGMALHWTGWGFPARSIWDDWSRTSSKFDPRDQDKTWRSFGPGSHGGRVITLGTLFALAKANGWRDGSSNNKLIAYAAGVLLARGIDPHACLDLVMEFNANHGDPDISEEEVAAIVAFVAGREFEKRARRHGAGVRHV